MTLRNVCIQKYH